MCGASLVAVDTAIASTDDRHGEHYADAGSVITNERLGWFRTRQAPGFESHDCNVSAYPVEFGGTAVRRAATTVATAEALRDREASNTHLERAGHVARV